jgi:uncharacterized membrane-anchored protein
MYIAYIAGLPRIDARYWVIMLLASACGTNLGDFASQTLDLGFIGAFVPYVLIFAAMFVAARRVQAGGEIFYWVAIVISRAGATDIADLASHQLKLDYPALAVLLLILLASILVVGLLRGQTTIVATRLPNGDWDDRPNSNATYWAAMVTASVIGTMSGDYLVDDFGLGVGAGSVLLLALTALATAVAARGQRLIKPLYWLTVLLMRTGATNLGDFLSGDDGLNLGFLAGSIGLLSLMLVVIALWKGRAVPRLQEA